MISFSNYFITPTGKRCMLREIKNNEYFVLLKYIQAKDYHGFYTSLDSIILETIPDFMDYDIIEKASVYLATCYYSVHNTIMMGNKIFGTTEINLSLILNALEDGYKSLPKSFTYNLKDNITIELGLPKLFDAYLDGLSINYVSSIKKINDMPLDSKESIEKFTTELPAKISVKIEYLVKKHYSQQCTLFEDLVVNLITSDLFYIIFQVFTEKLEDFYELLYYHFEYLKWDYATFCQFTPLETRILFNLFKVDKEKQAEERQKQMMQQR